MNILIVTSHPLNSSLCKLLTKHVSTKLSHQGHTITIEDLYHENFEPALTNKERKSYYSESYDYSKLSEQVKRLKEADALILLFPTWWFGFPAILKGWFDRVWGPGVAYKHASDLGAIKPLLDKLQKVLVITTLGSPWWVDWIVMRKPVKRVMKIALLTTCAKNSKLTFLSLYNSEKLNEKNIEAFKKKIDNVLLSWK